MHALLFLFSEHDFQIHWSNDASLHSIQLFHALPLTSLVTFLLPPAAVPVLARRDWLGAPSEMPVSLLTSRDSGCGVSTSPSFPTILLKASMSRLTSTARKAGPSSSSCKSSARLQINTELTWEQCLWDQHRWWDSKTQKTKRGERAYNVVDLFYVALFSALDQTHCACMWFYMRDLLFTARLLNVHRSGVLTALAWLVPHEAAAVSARSVYTIQPCTISLHAKPHT